MFLLEYNKCAVLQLCKSSMDACHAHNVKLWVSRMDLVRVTINQEAWSSGYWRIN